MSEASRRTTRPVGELQPTGFLRLSVIAGPAPPGMTFVLSGEEHGIGRGAGDVIIEEDDALEVDHARIRRDGTRCTIEALEGTTNGVWVRIEGEEAISPGQFFRLGQQVFFAEVLSEEAMAAADGTRYFASPARKAAFHVVQVLEGGVQGLAACSTSNRLRIGGSEGTVTISGDPFLSARHAEVEMKESGLVLRDLGSTNGTWLRVEGRQPLTHGALFYAGATLLRVEITPPV